MCALMCRARSFRDEIDGGTCLALAMLMTPFAIAVGIMLLNWFAYLVANLLR